MKKLISLLGLPVFLAALLPQVVFAYTGVNLANTEPDAVYAYNASAPVLSRYTNETTAAQDTVTDDVTINTDLSDSTYFGFSEMFDGVSIDIYTSVSGYETLDLGTGPDGTYVLEYWNGAWTELDVNAESALDLADYDIEPDSMNGVFNKIWQRPTDWTTTSVNSSSSMYYVRMRIDEEYSSSTTGTATQVGIIAYNLKVEVRDEFGDGIEGMEEGDFEFAATGSADDTVYSFEELENGIYVFAVDAPTTTGSEYELSIFPSGFVARDPARSGIDLDFSETIYELEDTSYSHVLEAENAAGGAVDIAEADAGASSVDCIIDGGEAYCPVDIGDDSSGTEAHLYADGYVSETGSIINRVSGSGQARDSFTMDYGYVATVSDQDGNVITNATVVAGDDLDTSCYYLGSGQYGCAISSLDSDPLVRVTASGYQTLASSFGSERSGYSSAQVSGLFRLDEGTTEEPETTEDGTDTDGDGISDVAETATGTDPLDEEDFLADAEDYDADCEDPFTDTAGNFAEISICILHDDGIVQGRSATLFEPSASITRAEFLKIALLNAGLTITADSTVSYTDVSSSDWYYSYITYATTEGYVEGYDDGTFLPNDEINRAEAMIMMMRIAGVVEADVEASDIDFDDVAYTDWFAWAVVEADENGISEGYSDGTFQPGSSITRAEVAVIARRVWYVYYE